MEKVLVVGSTDKEGLRKALSTICRSTDLLCYDPIDESEPLLSLTWIETLLHLESFRECVSDPECAKSVLSVFSETLKVAESGSYVFVIDMERLSRLAAELKHLKSDI